MSCYYCAMITYQSSSNSRGQNFLQSTLKLTYEHFLEQVNLAEQLSSSDFGVPAGLISKGYWEMSKWYVVNVERGNIADKLQPRHINVYVYIITMILRLLLIS